MKMVEYQESVVQGALERLLTRIGIEYSRKEYVPTNDEILDKLMSIDPEVQKLVLLNGKAAAMEMFVKQNYDLKGRYRNIFQGGRVPRNMTMKVINDYLDEVDAPSMGPSALEDYTSQMRSGLAEVTQRHIAKSVAQMTAWNWSRGRGIEELTRRFQEEQKKEQIDMSKVLPNAETVVRTESMKILNAEAWRSATEVGSYADGLLWGFSYHAVGDSRTRETHLAQHGVCAPVDDPFWNEWTPPNGYNCRCWLISEWEEPSSYKQPRRDLHPDPGFAFNPANNVAGRVPQPKKAEPKKPEVDTQPQESVVKPDELGKDDAASEKNFEKKGKNIQKPVTSSKKKRYNNVESQSKKIHRSAKTKREFVNKERKQLLTTPDGITYAVFGTSVEEVNSPHIPFKGIMSQDFGPDITIKKDGKYYTVYKHDEIQGYVKQESNKFTAVNKLGNKDFVDYNRAVHYLIEPQITDNNDQDEQENEIQQELSDLIGAERIKGKHSINQDLIATNPLYGTEGKKYNDNCQRCVIAYELRRRGFDVSAKPCAVDDSGNSIPEDIMFINRKNGFENAFENPEWISCGMKSIKGCKKKIADYMTSWGNGTRAIVSVEYPIGGHVFIAEQYQGRTIFLDPQSGMMNAYNVFNNSIPKKTAIMRIDNKKIANVQLVKDCCKNN